MRGMRGEGEKEGWRGGGGGERDNTEGNRE